MTEAEIDYIANL